MRPRPAPIHVSDDVLEDLRARLNATRWPAPAPGMPWEFGADLATVREVCRRWADGFDWRRHEDRLNALSPVLVEVDGLDLHVFRARADSPATPLLLIHGWPSSVVEFRRIIAPLTQGTPAFDLVMPSLPGFGFGGVPRESGWDVTHTAEAFHTLMTEGLGVDRYLVHGGDWGAIIGSRLAHLHPEAVIGLHTTMPLLGAHRDASWAEGASDAERAALAHWDAVDATERGYAAIQSTRPQTLGVAQTDSPAGLAAWVLEKFQVWSERGLAAFDVDDLLANLMFYWAPPAVTSAAMLYAQSRRDPEGRVHAPPEVPTAVAAFPADLNRAQRRWAEPHYRIVRWTDMPRGGHFPALEEPALLVEDIRAFAATLL